MCLSCAFLGNCPLFDVWLGAILSESISQREHVYWGFSYVAVALNIKHFKLSGVSWKPSRKKSFFINCVENFCMSRRKAKHNLSFFYDFIWKKKRRIFIYEFHKYLFQLISISCISNTINIRMSVEFFNIWINRFRLTLMRTWTFIYAY